MLGQIHYQLGNYEQARKNFEIAVRLEPDLKPAFYGLVRVHALEGNQQRAKNYMERFQDLSIEILTDRAPASLEHPVASILRQPLQVVVCP